MTQKQSDWIICSDGPGTTLILMLNTTISNGPHLLCCHKLKHFVSQNRHVMSCSDVVGGCSSVDFRFGANCSFEAVTCQYVKVAVWCVAKVASMQL